MKYLPSWVPFEREAARARQIIESLVDTPFGRAQKEMVSYGIEHYEHVLKGS